MNFRITKQNYILYILVLILVLFVLLYILPQYLNKKPYNFQNIFGTMTSPPTIREGMAESDGLIWSICSGYFNDDVTFPSRCVPPSRTVDPNCPQPTNGTGTLDFSNLTTMTNGAIQRNGNEHQYSIQFLGNFLPDKSGTWYFRTISDDASYLWLGTNAKDGNYTATNAIVQNGGLHPMQAATGSANLTKNVLYPIRIQMGENWGGYDLTVQWSSDGGNSWSSNGNGYMYSTLYNNMSMQTQQYTPGLNLTVYNNYFADNVNFSSNSTVMTKQGQQMIFTGVTNLSSISSMTNNWIIENMGTQFKTDGTPNGYFSQNNNTNDHNYSIELTGYFSPNVSGDWQFYTISDDASYLWIGNAANIGWSTSNATINNGGIHGMTYQSATVQNLQAGKFYPIRIQYGENSGGYGFVVGFKAPNSSTWYTNGSGLLYSSTPSSTNFNATIAVT